MSLLIDTMKRKVINGFLRTTELNAYEGLGLFFLNNLLFLLID